MKIEIEMLSGNIERMEQQSVEMAEYRFTEYFEKEVLRKRPYIKKEWCARVLDKPLRSEPQEKNRHRF